MNTPLPTSPAWRCHGRLAAALCSILVSLAASSARAYVLLGPRWSDNSQVVMHLQLGGFGGSGTTIDGSTSWDHVAEDALAIWNPYIGSGVQFYLSSDAAAQASGDGKNVVFFSNNLFGKSFDSDAIATTLSYTNTSTNRYTESDVVVNTAFSYNSYRGPQKDASAGGTLIDLRRVLLHEFGHALGLGHSAQGSASIMAPAITDYDNIQADDIAGVQAIYGVPPKTNLAPHVPPGWSDTLPCSNVSGTNTNAPIRPTDTTYVDWAIINNSPVNAGAFKMTISLDNGAVVKTHTSNQTLTAGHYVYGIDDNFGQLKAGVHTVTMFINSDSTLPESSRNDNVYIRRLVVAPTAKDINSDSTSDLVWQNTRTGARDIWTLRNGALYQNVHFADIPTEWQIATVGDFNNDGNPDIFWQNTRTGDRDVWLMQGMVLKSIYHLGNVPTAWQIAGVGDVNADGEPDIVWQNTQTGERDIWIWSGQIPTDSGPSYIFNPRLLTTVPTEWRIAAVGDLSGDNVADLLWENVNTGQRDVWVMRHDDDKFFVVSNIYSLGNIPTVWQIAGLGDFNADSFNDIIWQNTQTGERDIWYRNASSTTQIKYFGNIATEWSIANH